MLRSFFLASTGKSFPCLPNFSHLGLPRLLLQLCTCESALHWFAWWLVFSPPARVQLSANTSRFWESSQIPPQLEQSWSSCLWVLHGAVQNLRVVPSCSWGGPRACCRVSGWFLSITRCLPCPIPALWGSPGSPWMGLCLTGLSLLRFLLGSGGADDALWRCGGACGPAGGSAGGKLCSCWLEWGGFGFSQ